MTSGYPHLVVLDPSAGIAVIDAPSLSVRERRRRTQGRVFDSLEMVGVADSVAARAEEVRRGVDKRAISKLPVRCVIAVPDHDEVPLEELASVDQNLPILARSDLAEDVLPSALKRVLGGERSRPLNDQEEKRARAVVNPTIILTARSSEQLPLVDEPEIAPEDAIRVMDRDQERLAEHLPPGYRVIKGVAGSGKTVVLAHRARFLHRCHPTWRVLLVCFNRVLARALEAMVSADHRLEVINIDRLAYRLVKAAGGSVPPGYDERVVVASKAAASLPAERRFDAVLVDEAQDFDHARLGLAYAMLKPDRSSPDGVRRNRDNFVMAYDRAQNVYARSGASWNPPGLDPGGGPRTQRGRVEPRRKDPQSGRWKAGLHRNYRNARDSGTGLALPRPGWRTCVGNRRLGRSGRVDPTRGRNAVRTRATADGVRRREA